MHLDTLSAGSCHDVCVRLGNPDALSLSPHIRTVHATRTNLHRHRTLFVYLYAPAYMIVHRRPPLFIHPPLTDQHIIENSSKNKNHKKSRKEKKSFAQCQVNNILQPVFSLPTLYGSPILYCHKFITCLHYPKTAYS